MMSFTQLMMSCSCLSVSHQHSSSVKKKKNHTLTLSLSLRASESQNLDKIVRVLKKTKPVLGKLQIQHPLDLRISFLPTRSSAVAAPFLHSNLSRSSLRRMDVPAIKSSLGYANPPWQFKGSALYQLHLVKAETARAFIPKEFRLVEAFGYTLGGFFLAHYDDSPAGIFDELVVIAGIVWNPPTSCAWAARVLVNSREACMHGRKDIGLPSQVAGFSKQNITAFPERRRSKSNNFLNMIGVDTAFSNSKDRMDIQVTEIEGSAATDFCNIKLSTSLPNPKSGDKWMGPAVKMSLPSFSGRTQYNPQLLKYSCQIECRVRAVKPAKVSSATPPKNDDESSDGQSFRYNDSKIKAHGENDARDQSISVLLSKPVLALEFNFLKMQVEAPTVIPHRHRVE